jgi:hypothetical protein
MTTDPYFLRAAHGGRVVAQPIGLITAVGIERALVGFIGRLFEHARLDNEAIDQLYDAPPEGLERIQLLTGKLAPRVYAGFIPLTITGEIEPTALPDYPAIVIMTDKVEHDYQMGILDIRILAGTFDRDKTKGGRVDCLNIMEALDEAFFAFPEIGEVAALAPGNKRTHPVHWEMNRINLYPYYFAEMTVSFQVATSTNYLSALAHQPGFPPVPTT